MQLWIEGANNTMYRPTSNVATKKSGTVSYQPPQKDDLIWSIINMICFCPPLGLAAVVYSIKTRNAIEDKNGPLASKHFRTAYRLNVASTFIGVIWIAIFLICYFIVPKIISPK